MESHNSFEEAFYERGGTFTYIFGIFIPCKYTVLKHLEIMRTTHGSGFVN